MKGSDQHSINHQPTENLSSSERLKAAMAQVKKGSTRIQLGTSDGSSRVAIGDGGAGVLAGFLSSNLNVMHLDLCNNRLGGKGVSHIASVLGKNEVIAYLDLSHNNMGEEGAESLKKCLVRNDSIKHLDVSYNGLDVTTITRKNPGIKAIADIITVNKAITLLNLSGNKLKGAIEDLASGIWANSCLETLLLSDTGLEDEGLSEIVSAIDLHGKIHSLDFSKNKISDVGIEKVASLIASNKNIKSVNLSDNNLTNKGVDVLINAIKRGSVLHLELDQNNKIDKLKIEVVTQLLKENWQKAAQSLPVDPLSPSSATVTPYSFEGVLNSRAEEERINDISNALNQYLNPLYQYQAKDLETIGQSVLGDKSTGFIGVLPKADKQKELLQAKESIGFWQHGKHFSCFRVIQQDDNVVVLYKDSLGKSAPDAFRQFISDSFPKKAISFREHPVKEQQFGIDSVSSGIFALKNLRLLASMPEEAIDSFARQGLYAPGLESMEYWQELQYERQNFARDYANGMIRANKNQFIDDISNQLGLTSSDRTEIEQTRNEDSLVDLLINKLKSVHIEMIARVKSPDWSLTRLDLREVDGDLISKLAKYIANNNTIGHVLWDQVTNSYTKIIENKLIANNKNYRYFPSDYEYALLSLHSYSDAVRAETPRFSDEAKTRVLAKWRVLEVHNDLNKTGYYGVSYINVESGQIVLAHRGAELVLKDLVSENTSVNTVIKGVLGGKVVEQQITAYVVTRHVLEKAKQMHYSFSVTGHSLGAFLAELSSYYCYYDFDYTGVRAVTFESPGSASMLDSFKSNVRSYDTENELREVDIITYLTYPTMMNSCNEHVGKVYRMYSAVKPQAFLEKLQGLGKKIPFVGKDVEKRVAQVRSIFGQSLLAMIEGFEERTGKPKEYVRILDWPKIQYKPSETGAVKSAVDSLVDLVPFSKFVPDSIKSVISGAVSCGINAVIGDKTLISIVDLLADYASGNIKEDQYLSFLEQANNREFRLNKDIDANKAYEVQYQGHYQEELVDEKHDVSKQSIGGTDWYLRQLDRHKININKMSSTVLSSLSKEQLELMASSYDIRAERGIKHIFIKPKIVEVSVDELRQNFRRLLEVNPETRIAIGRAMKNDLGQEAIPELQRLSSGKAEAGIIHKWPKTDLVFDVPIARAAQFTGRIKEFDQLDVLFKEKQVVVVSAHGGTGKSSFAVEYANKLKERYQVSRWFYGDGKLNIGYESVGKELGLDVDGKDDKFIMDAVHSRLSKGKEQILFIYDNIEDEQYAVSYATSLPKHIKLLITTRNPRLKLSENQGHIHIEPFTMEESLEYITMALKVTKEKATRLIEAVGTLPFRLGKAVAYLQENRLEGIEDYIRLYNELKTSNARKASPELEIVLGKLLEKSEAAWRLLQYSCYLDPDYIAKELLDEITGDKKQTARAVNALESLSLAEVTTNAEGEKGIRLHRLMQAEVREYSSYKQERSIKASEVMMQLAVKLDKLMPKVENTQGEDWRTATSLNKHILMLQENVDQAHLFTPELANLHFKQYWYYRSSTNDVQAVFDNAVKSLKIRQELYKKEPFNGVHEDIARSLNAIGASYNHLGKYQEALDYSIQALKMRQELYKKEPFNGVHESIAESLIAVGVAYKHLGKYQEGSDCSMQSLKMRQELYKKEPFNGMHEDIVQSLNEVGVAYDKLGKDQESLDYSIQALKMSQELYKKALFNGVHGSIAELLSNVGILYGRFSKDQESLDYSIQALKMSQELYKKEPFNGVHESIAESLIAVGVAYKHLGEYQESLDYSIQALKMRQELYKKEPFNGVHESIAVSLYLVGVSYNHLGKYQEGLDYSTQSLKMSQELYKKEPFNGVHESIAESLIAVGCSYDNLNNIKQALVYYQDAVEMNRKLYGPDDKRTTKIQERITSLSGSWTYKIIKKQEDKQNSQSQSQCCIVQ